MSLPNIYNHRRVGPASSKPCFICYKPTTSVLITPDSRDFFYTCAGHLADRGFAQPIGEPVEDAAAKAKREELERAIEEVKKEYEEKQRKKKKKDKKKDEEVKKEKEKEDETKDEKDRDDKITELQKGSASDQSNTDDGPRVYALHKNIYQMRVTRLKNMQMTKNNQQRSKTPIALPSVPSGDLG